MNDLYVREQPNGYIMGSIDKDTVVEIDGKTSGKWTHAKVEGIGIGWIWTAYLKKDGNTTTKENAIITNKQDKTQKLFDGVVKAQPTLNVRSWAGTEYPKIKKVPELLNGREVEVMNYTQKDTAGAKWCYVRITCGEKKYFGFCKAQYIVKK